MNPKTEEVVATLREYAPDEDGTQRYILIPAAGRGAIAEYPVTVRSHRTDIMRDAADLIEQLQQELIDERYRHDRYADFCVAQGEELSKLKNDIVRCKDCDRRGEEGCPMRFWEATVIKHDGLKWSDYEFKDQTEDNGFCHMGVQKREVKTND